MPHGREPTVHPVRDPQRVPDLLSAVQDPPSVHLMQQLGAADLCRVEVSVPPAQILHGRVQAGGPHHVEVRDADPQLPILSAGIGVGAIRDDGVVIVVEMGVPHPQGPEDPLLGEFLEGLAGDRSTTTARRVKPVLL